ncbi:MAG: prepilin-type N-terminal cleavage/methylation domain-containing protein [Armatimonadota bacterium]
MTGYTQKYEKNKGMTLIEVIIFVALFSVFIMFTAMIFKNAVNVYRFGKTRTDIKHNAAISLDSICRDLMTARYVEVEGGAPYPVSLNKCNLVINYSKKQADDSTKLGIIYRIAVDKNGVKQLVRKKIISTVLADNLSIPYEPVAEYIDDVIVSKITTPDPYNPGKNLHESYRVKVTAKIEKGAVFGVPEGKLVLISQITPRAYTEDAVLKPVVICDGTVSGFYGLKPQP